ncbi:hypothetical protein IV102_05725 [bacterium]|nr:hypothetical protein [bacterium]
MRELAQLCLDWGQVYWAEREEHVPADLDRCPLILDGAVQGVRELLCALLGPGHVQQLRAGDRNVQPPYDPELATTVYLRPE